MDHFVITPSIRFFSCENDFTKNSLGEEGKAVDLGSEYNSGTNPHFLTLDEITVYNSKL
jgi:UDP-N-acetylglucosamine 4,6-dehydratase